jgi:hypothetical protein
MFSLQHLCETVSQLASSSGVVLNGRPLNWPEAVAFQQLCGRPIMQGRYQVNACGDVSHEGGRVVCNVLAQLAQRANRLLAPGFPPRGQASGHGGGGVSNCLPSYDPTGGNPSGGATTDPLTSWGPAAQWDSSMFGNPLMNNPFMNYDATMPTYDPTMMNYAAGFGGFDGGLFGNTMSDDGS